MKPFPEGAALTPEGSLHEDSPLEDAEQIFFEALLKPPEKRLDFVRRRCAGEDGVEAEVLALLDAHETPSGFLEAAVAAGVSALEEDEAEGTIRLGPYRLVREVGRGGLSSVYLAMRADGEFHRRVAVKVLRRGMDTEDILRRFRAERQILAGLDHPAIARLLDGGTTEDGRPYFVLEFIDGLPLNVYCDRHDLSLERRLELFREVCAAVHYAHQNLVVHRDLKPGNILVTPEGAPKLLDFGIAKLLSPESFAGTQVPTAAWMRPMTPAYASPEQVLGEGITTASDVYSLGVVLYELLAGRRPHDLSGEDSPGRIEEMICRREPAPPSVAAGTVGETAVLGRRLRGDLDDIVLTALRKEPGRRYGSAKQLADDVDRFLSGRPVLARKDTLRYRAGKFLRRNLRSVALASLVLAGMLAFGGALAVQSEAARRERLRAEQVAGLLNEIFSLTSPNTMNGGVVSARELLDLGAERASELEDGPATALLLMRLARLYHWWSHYEQTSPMLERARRILEEHDPGGKALIDCLAMQAELQGTTGELITSEATFRTILDHLHAQGGEDHPRFSYVLRGLGAIRHLEGRYGEAKRLYEEALMAGRQRLSQKGRAPRPDWITQTNLARLERDFGDPAEAERILREALEGSRTRLPPEHPVLSYRRDLLGAVLHLQGRSEEALEELVPVMRLRREQLGDEHMESASSFLHAGAALCAVDPASEGLEHLQRGLRTYRERYGPRHHMVARSLLALGRCQAARSRGDEAEQALLGALEVFRIPCEEHPWAAETLLALGELRAAGGRCSEAEADLRQALGILQRTLPEDNWRIEQARSVRAASLEICDRGQNERPPAPARAGALSKTEPPRARPSGRQGEPG